MIVQFFLNTFAANCRWNFMIERETILKPGVADTSKLPLAQLQYLTNYCTNFQTNHSKTVEVGNTRLLEYDT